MQQVKNMKYPNVEAIKGLIGQEFSESSACDGNRANRRSANRRKK